MAKAAIIVESPAKTRTLQRFLGDGYELMACMGHVRDLPDHEMAVDIEHGFRPSYTTNDSQSKVLAKLRKALKGVDQVYLASDPDREGEAIAWHLAEALGLADAQRIEFNEITESAVRGALEHPRRIDMDRVNAQQARRVIDRLVGYMLSPLLWEKLTGGRPSGLSAGRVQSAALRLICEREREVAAFIADEYWSVTATLTPFEVEAPFEAQLRTKGGEELELKTAEQAEPAAEALRHLPYEVGAIQRKERRRAPQPPFITSTLQRAAANALGFSARKTMTVAQLLYQGVETPDGPLALITYMRTDSTRIADQARQQAVEYIKGRYGEAFVGPGATGKKAKGAQEAHEAIRPTYVEHTPESVQAFLDADQMRLYELIWRRFVASQMAAAVYDQTTVEITAGPYGLRATGSVVKFAGFLSVQGKEDEEEEEGKSLPPLQEGQALKPLGVSADQHFTKPPPRYTEATLVRELEENGVGRPSTYATIIETLRSRKYVRMDKRQFIPTALGFSVNDYLVGNFPEIIDVEFTARVEGELDDVENGDVDWVSLLGSFYGPFKARLEEAQKASPRVLEGEACPECGGRLMERFNRFGKFAGCENYPECKYTRDLLGDLVKKTPAEPTGEKCPECGKDLVRRQGPRGSTFVGCSGYPKCTYKQASGEDSGERAAPEPTGEKCPQCGKELLVRQGRRGPFLGCSGYPKCKYTRDMAGEKPSASAAIVTDIACEKCGKPMTVRSGRRGPFLGCSGFPKCRTTRNLTDEEQARWLPQGEGASEDGD